MTCGEFAAPEKTGRYEVVRWYCTICGFDIMNFKNSHDAACCALEEPWSTMYMAAPDACTYYLPDGSSIDKCKTQALLANLQPGAHSIMLVVTNAFGCTDTAWHTVYMNEGVSLYVPNTFTPNADGENDVFYAYGRGIKTFEMIIFDRWGNEIYKMNDLGQGWDGRNKTGQTVKQDVYVWKIIARDMRDEPIKMEGRVTVIY